MFVKHSWAGSRLIHARPCVGRAPKGTLAGYEARGAGPRSRTCTYVYRTTTTGRAWENLSPAIIVYLSPGSPDDGDMFRFLVPFHTRRGLFIMRIERAEGDKDPVRSPPPGAAPRPTDPRFRERPAGSMCHPVFVSIPPSISNRAQLDPDIILPWLSHGSKLHIRESSAISKNRYRRAIL